MFSARYPPRLAVPSPCLFAVPFLVPFRLFVSPRSSCRVAGRGARRARSWLRGRVGVAGRAVGCLVGAGLFSRVSWSIYLFHCISFRGGFRCRDGGFRASLTACLVLACVRFRPLLFISLRLLVSLRLVGCRPVSRPVCLVGGAVRQRTVACLPVPSCLIRLAITRHASRDVIVQIAPLIVSFYCFSSPFAPFIDTIGGEATLLAHRAAAL